MDAIEAQLPIYERERDAHINPSNLLARDTIGLTMLNPAAMNWQPLSFHQAILRSKLFPVCSVQEIENKACDSSSYRQVMQS
jgi:hypothetical protein